MKMTLAVALLGGAGCTLAALQSGNTASHFALQNLDESGRFDIDIDGTLWFEAGDPPSFRSGGRHLSPGSGLKLLRMSNTTGSDSMGSFDRISWEWSSAGASDDASFVTAVRKYDSALVFEQHFIHATEGSGTGDVDKIISAFPSLSLPRESNKAPERAYLQYAKAMVGSGYHLGRWDAKSSGVGSGIAGTGPLCIFRSDLRGSVVISPYSNFMAASQYFADGHLAYGVMGNVSSVPAGFVLETLVQYTPEAGPNAAMVEWGSRLLDRYGKKREDAWARDVSLQKLGYSTDNGAYYYYNTEPKKNYQQTMIDVAQYAREQGLPYAYWLADSWWYYKSQGGGGVTNWTARPDVFPDGFAYVTAQTGWLVQGHNRYWDGANVYAKFNGGEYDFAPVDERTNFTLPVSQEFWDDLMRNSSQWGLRIYEQDWLDTEFDNFGPLTQSATLATQWLAQMAAAAEKHGITIQYCMSYCRHILASVALPSVTQARASDDYHPGRDQWHALGTTGLFAWAVGLGPSKDNFWTTADQPGASHYSDHPREPKSRLESAVITLTKGPVAPSDAIGKSDPKLIMRSCAADGTLLQPARPATKLDSFFLAGAMAADKRWLHANEHPTGEVWSADTTISGRRFSVVLTANLSAPYTLSPGELGYENDAALVATEANSTSRFVRLGAGGGKPGLQLAPCGVLDFALWNIAPVEPNGWAVLGEVRNKWIGVSTARITSVTSSGPNKLAATVKGKGGEEVEIAFAPPTTSPQETVFVRCVLPACGTATIQMPGGTCA